MVEDGRGTKWIGTAAGLDILDSEYSSFTHFDLHRNPDTPVNPYIGRLLEVPAAGTLIVGTGGAGVFVIDSETRQELPEKRETVNRTLHTDYIHTLFLDASGRLWILPGDSKPVVLDAITLEPANGPELLKAGDQLRVNDMAEDPVTGDILLGSTEGLLLFKAGSGLIRKASGRRAATTVAASVIFDSQTASGEERLFLVGNEDGGLLHFDTETEEVRNGGSPDRPRLVHPAGNRQLESHFQPPGRAGKPLAGPVPDRCPGGAEIPFRLLLHGIQHPGDAGREQYRRHRCL